MKLPKLSIKIRTIAYIFFVFQLLSILGYVWPSISNIIFWLIILGAVWLSLHRIEYGFLILFFEFFAGHQGHMFEFAGLSLRLSLFLVVMFIWLIKKIINKEHGQLLSQFLKSPGLSVFLIFLFVIFLALFQGLIQNNPVLAIKDFINYSYLFLIFPLIDILKKVRFQKSVFKLSQAATIGLGLLTIIVLILFVINLAEVHDQFYWWWRGTVIGKATATSNNFFRIVTPAHLLILPLFLVYLSFLTEIRKLKSREKKWLIWLSIFASSALLINFSRAYFLGILIGLILLAKGLNWRRWLVFSCLVILILIIEFGLLFGLVNGGQALQGLDFFKNRMRTLISPEQEISSLTRMNILPRLIEKISDQPIFGRGLGATVSYIDQLTGQEKSTFHLDWGYLEIWLELGLFGLISYGLILFYIFYQGWQKIKILSRDIFQKRLIIGLLAGLASLIVATLTGPFLFHSLGIFYLILTLSIIVNVKKDDTKAYNPDCYLE